jgi:O-antigen/teichoic acid export membrane protein
MSSDVRVIASKGINSSGELAMVSSDLDISHKIVRNTLFNASARVWGIVVAIFLTPYIIHRIGGERYGIWAIIGTVTGYFGLLDLGVETGFVKYISEFYAKKEYQRINQIVNTGVIFYSLLMLVLLAVMSLSIGPIFSFLNLSSAPGSEVKFVFLTGAVIFCLSNALSPIIAIQNGLQRMDLLNKVSVCMSAVTVAGTVFFLENGYGLKGLVFTSALVFCCSGTVNIVLAFKIFPHLCCKRAFQAFQLWLQTSGQPLCQFGKFSG